jgi:N6-adenosine-specific RNA methylase IME4
MQGREFEALVEDVRLHGVREPIVLYEDAILDGRNRYRAARQAGIECPTGEWQGEDPVAFVMSLNLHRRHLDESQRAMVAANLANMPTHRPASNGKSANLPTSQDSAAKMLSVSPRSVRHAVAVKDRAEPELRAAVEQGHIAVSVAAKAAKLSAKLQREVAKRAVKGEVNAAAKAVKQETRKEREKTLGAQQLALPDKKYGVILCDNEWRFETWSEEGMDRSADNHYPTSSLDALKARDVPSIAADVCTLFMWTTVPMLVQALEVMKAWGFDYKSQMVWVKKSNPDDKAQGTGYWFRNQHEILLLGTKGEPPTPAMGTQAVSILYAPVGAHSAKPVEVLELIERYFPTLPKIELNRRGPARAGWAAWGNEHAPG